MLTRSSLLAVLETMDGLLDPPQRAAITELRRRLELQRFRVLVVGEAKRGKSTLINALLRRQVLPVGVVPVTAVTTTVTFGVPERVVVEYGSGVSEEEPVVELARFVSESGNPGNRLGVAGVTVFLDAPLVCDGVELVDTPGAGSVYAHDAEAARALALMDAAVFVLTADPPLSSSERELLVRVSDASVRTFLVLNKADRLEADELREVEQFVTQATSEVLGAAPEVFACSARQSLTARLAGAADPRSGMDRFESAFFRYLRSGRAEGLQRSVARRARIQALSAWDGVRIRLRLAEMQDEEATQRTEELRHRLAVVGQAGVDAGDLASAGVRRLLEELNDAAAAAEPVLAGAVVGQTRRRLDGELAQIGAARLREEGRGFVVDAVQESVQVWRTDQQQRLENGLREVEDRLLAGLAAELGRLRTAAMALLGLELSVEEDRSRLVEDSRFFYLLGESVGWSELVTDTIRRHLPGAAARRRAVEDLIAEADRLTRQQVGRVRADLQYRLQESGRGLSRAIRVRYAASTAAIEAALDDAVHAQGHTEAETARTCADLQGRESALLSIVDRLDDLGS